VPAGESDKLVCTIDMAASFAKLAGAELKKEACIDSFNVLGAILGEKGATGRDHLVQQDNGRGGNYGLRVGNWKLQRHDSKKARNVKVEVHLANTNVTRYRLYDLSKDPGEKKNVIDTHPEVAKRLIVQLQKVITDGRSRH
jgi:arylsulfatase A